MMRPSALSMAPASSITGLAVALLLVPGLAAARPLSSGPFRAEHYGQFELMLEGETLSGVQTQSGGACSQVGKGKVLEGTLQGSVFVGWLKVCQTGNGCVPEQAYSILGFYNEDTQILMAHVRLRSGCESPVLSNKRFVLQAMAPEKATPGASPGVPTLAAELAGKRGNPKFEQARAELEKGERHYLNKQYKEAAEAFQRSVDSDPSWSAYLGLGSSQLKLGQVTAAIGALDRASKLQPNNPNVLYMLGCAHAAQTGGKKRSLGYLRQTVELGYELHTVIEGDPELVRQLGNDREFQALVKRSKEKKAAFSRGTPGPGTPSP
ncbi:tetratricopeptide repeat protein [Stigmatella sp. ncwal1]|uniref:Tetratricopeptide repeat protein n=1 Tax=Stigmatella ashevillensis TaxID=2995309 RepID=A0ABT5D469_9BACT|nr:tetratricopeptide repeat protein [Stigmatella ashevillena]MDC0708465.1 tetratricopeptide repeat protein [Stigmatella ashevillena]